MKKLTQSQLAPLLFAFCPLVLLAVNEPIIFEAESGSLPDPAIFATTTAVVGGVNVTFVRVTGDFPTGVTTTPGTDSRVITYTVTFPSAGIYDLYARYRVGAGGGSDDSFYYGNGFGVKVPANGTDWITTNNLSGAGYSANQNIVLGAGAGNSFKWLKLSAFTNGGEGPLQFIVPEGALTQTFQIGSRENGLDFDKFAFGVPGIYYTVANLNAGVAGSSTPPPPPYTPPANQLPLATGKAKYLGSAHSNAQAPFFINYWNQVTPENAGKWGSVEGTRDVMNWTQLDTAYNLAKNNGFPFKMHVMIWGNQQPAWIRLLPPAEQLEEIEEWFAAVAARYPALDYVEVVNEPLHDPPTFQNGAADGGNYIEALGGANGTDGTGWDWVLNSFRLARLYFPASTKLVLNDYSITNTNSATTTYLQIIDILKSENLIDVVGFQGHAFSTTGSMSTHIANMDRLAATGLPLQVTELDIDGPTDQIQLDQYKRIFPTFWEHPAVQGITLWGWRPGHWRTAQGAYLVNDDGGERPALKWLMDYVRNTPPAVTPAQVFSASEDAANGTGIGTVLATDVDANTTFQGWQITGGTGAAIFAIDAATGQLSVADSMALDFETTTGYTLTVRVGDGLINSATETVTITLLNANDNTPVIVAGQSFAIDGGSQNVVGTAVATDADDINQPGYTVLQNWQISGGSNAAGFSIDPNTGAISLSNADAIDFRQSSYTLAVTVTDSLNVSAVETITVLIPDRVMVTKRGRTHTVSKMAIPGQMRAGATLGGP